MARRSKAREVALQMLFQVDLNSDVAEETVKGQISEELKAEDLREFAWTLYSGTLEYRNELDEQIERFAENWSLTRMAPTDRNILRLGGYELNHVDTPANVVIDEMIELAKTFGSENSPQFVNGILDRMMPKDADAR